MTGTSGGLFLLVCFSFSSQLDTIHDKKAGGALAG